MTEFKTELDALYQKIMAVDAGDRAQFQKQLTRLVDRAVAHGEPVRADIRLLNDELVNDAIEAQFDNMPV